MAFCMVFTFVLLFDEAVQAATPPSALQTLVVSSFDSTSVTLTWSSPVSDGGSDITDYAIEYRKSGSESWSTYTDGVSTNTSTTVTGLDRGALYEFRVSAVNSQGTGWGSENISTAAGNEHSCSVLFDGSISCWGNNNLGQLGNGTQTNSFAPVPVSGISTAVSVTSDYGVSCALLSSQKVMCWGENVFGELGDGTTDSSNIPVTVSGINSAIAISTGNTHSCALLLNQTVVCWGSNHFGQLGDGTTTDSLIPIVVPEISSAISVSAGWGSTCAVLSSGEVRCWGWNGFGKLGDGTGSGQLSPVKVVGISNAVSVSSGFASTCAVLLDNSVKCWGFNENGQLGDGTNLDSASPVSVQGITSAKYVTVGGYHACALLLNSTVKCWGDNRDGELGDATYISRNTPVTSQSISDANVLSAGQDHTCVTLSDHTTKCWGANRLGQLGNYSTAHSSFPVYVPLFVNQIPSTVPNAASSPSASVLSRTSLSVSWNSPSDDGGQAISSYDVQYSSDGGSSWLPETPLSVIGNSTNISGLITGSSYKIRVAALNPVGRSSWTSSSTGTLLASSSDSVSGLSVSSYTSTSASLWWSDPFSNGGSPITDYAIQYRVRGAFSWTEFSDGTSTTAGVTITGLTRGANYEFRVGAVNSQGTSWSSAVSQIPSSVPGTLTSLVPTVTSRTSMTLSWLAPSDNGGQPMTSYNIQYSSDSGVTWLPATPISVTGTAATLNTLTPGASYRVRVAAVNPVGQGSWFVSGPMLVSDVVGIKKYFVAKTLATQVGISLISPKATVTLSVASSTRAVCTISNSKLKTLKTGTCKVTFTVQEPAPKKGKKPKATKSLWSFVVQ